MHVSPKDRVKIPASLSQHEESFRRSLVIFSLYLLPLTISLNLFAVTDPDIWWHLRTGEWILQQGTVPVTDPFSAYGQDKPWVAYSWLFEVVIYGIVQRFGLVGLVLHDAVLSFAITYVLYVLIRRVEPRFINSVVLTAVAIFAIAPLLLYPRPWLYTILFFILELNLLLAVRISGDKRLLLLLPPIFLAWANVHIQFTYGLLALGLAAIEPLLVALFRRRLSIAELRGILRSPVWLILAACGLATLINPYHLRIYQVFWEYLGQAGAFKLVSELSAPNFRSPDHWVALLATLGALYALGSSKQYREQPFWASMLAFGVVLFFRAQRDAWFAIVPAVVILAMASRKPFSERPYTLSTTQILATSLAIMLTCLLVVRGRGITEENLHETVSGRYPKAAAAFVARHGYPGPLYNHFDWGGFLIWQLRALPVSMDGRTNLHGDKRIERSVKTWAGRRDWASDPELSAARLVIASPDQALYSLLRLDPRYRLVYEDKVAAVFASRDTGGAAWRRPRRSSRIRPRK